MRQGHYLVELLADAASIDFATCDRETARRVVFGLHSAWMRSRFGRGRRKLTPRLDGSWQRLVHFAR